MTQANRVFTLRKLCTRQMAQIFETHVYNVLANYEKEILTETLPPLNDFVKQIKAKRYCHHLACPFCSTIDHCHNENCNKNVSEGILQVISTECILTIFPGCSPLTVLFIELCFPEIAYLNCGTWANFANKYFLRSDKFLGYYYQSFPICGKIKSKIFGKTERRCHRGKTDIQHDHVTTQETKEDTEDMFCECNWITEKSLKLAFDWRGYTSSQPIIFEENYLDKSSSKKLLNIAFTANNDVIGNENHLANQLIAVAPTIQDKDFTKDEHVNNIDIVLSSEDINDKRPATKTEFLPSKKLKYDNGKVKENLSGDYVIKCEDELTNTSINEVNCTSVDSNVLINQFDNICCSWKNFFIGNHIKEVLSNVHEREDGGFCTISNSEFFFVTAQNSTAKNLQFMALLEESLYFNFYLFGKFVTAAPFGRIRSSLLLEISQFIPNLEKLSLSNSSIETWPFSTDVFQNLTELQLYHFSAKRFETFLEDLIRIAHHNSCSDVWSESAEEGTAKVYHQKSASFLTNVKTIRVVGIDFQVSGLMGVFLNFLEIFRNTLISFVGEENIFFAESYWECVHYFMALPHLEVLYLTNYQISGLSNSTSHFLKPCYSSNLWCLDISDTPLSTDGLLDYWIREIQTMESLTTLNLSNTLLYDNGIICLSNAFYKMPKLKNLNLDDCCITTEGLEVLCKVLNESQIERLSMRNNNLAKKGALDLINQLFCFNEKLKYLDLTYCRLLENSIWFGLEEALSRNRSLTTLNLSQNRINDECLIRIAKAISYVDNSLSHLCLDFNMITIAGAKTFIAAFSEKEIRKHKIKYLSLKNNFSGITSSHLMAMYDVLDTVSERVSLSCVQKPTFFGFDPM